jgi:hypothetical protein
MAIDNYRGLKREHEVKADRGYRDTRRMEQRVRDSMSNPRHAAVFIGVGYLLCFVSPMLLWLLIPTGTIFALFAYTSDRYLSLPLRLPAEAPIKRDRQFRSPAGGFAKPEGVFHLGVDRETDYQIWQGAAEYLQHWLVVGASGSGKTVMLIGMVANAIATGSGAYFSDAKATPDLAWRLYTLARVFGRDHDFLAVNYITGAAKTTEYSPARLTNTDNPYATGTADTLMQMMTSLMSESGDSNQIFQDRAIAMLTAVLYALTELRDKDIILMSIDKIRESTTLEKIIELRHHPEVSAKTQRMLLSYLKSALPGYDDTLPAAKQPEEVNKQHTYGSGYFTRSLSSIIDTYGRIYDTDMGEVDRADIVVNKRIAVTMLPPLEKSIPELEMLGRLNFAATKDSLRIGLGQFLEGSKEEVLDNLPTATNIPFVMIFDELAYQITEGMAVTAAQARGLGLCMVYAMQDFAGPQRANEKEFQQIVGSTRSKFIMLTEDPKDTWEQISTIGGEGMTFQTQSYERGGDANDYQDQQSVQFNQRRRIDLADIRDQIEGEGLLLFGSRIIPMTSFNTVDLPLIDNFRLNRFMCVGSPREEDYPETSAYLTQACGFFANAAQNAPTPTLSAALERSFKRFDDMTDEGAVLAAVSSVAVYGAGDNTEDEASSAGGRSPAAADLDIWHDEELDPDFDELADDSQHDDDVPADPREYGEHATATTGSLTAEPEVIDDDEGAEDDNQPPPDPRSFIDRALDDTPSDYLFAYNAQYDIDYDIAESVSQIEQDIGSDGHRAKIIGSTVAKNLEALLRYPTPPPPALTSDIRDDVDASLARLIAMAKSRTEKATKPATELKRPADESKAGSSVFSSSNPDNDI